MTLYKTPFFFDTHTCVSISLHLCWLLVIGWPFKYVNIILLVVQFFRLTLKGIEPLPQQQSMSVVIERLLFSHTTHRKSCKGLAKIN